MCVTDKGGAVSTLTELPVGSVVNAVDYRNRFYRAGVEFKHRLTYGRLEYGASDYTNDVTGGTERSSSRLRITALTPVPMYDRIVIGGGFQHFENAVETLQDTLSANTLWGTARYSNAAGYMAKYSFIFDRATRTGDYAATDNIRHAINIGKTWRNLGGLMVGYGHSTNDDIRVERSGSEYSVSGWLMPVRQLTLRAGIGYVSDDVDSGKTLTGDRDYARHWLLARYRFTDVSIRIRADNRHRSNNAIGSEYDFIRLAGDVSFTKSSYGEVVASYSFGEGEYSNSSGTYAYDEHVLAGDAVSRQFILEALTANP